MKKKFLLLVLLLTLPIVLFGCDKGAESEGSINVIVLNHEKQEEFNGNISYQKEDTLLGILQAHEIIALKGEVQSFGFYILEVCGINVNEYTNVYWSILVNGEYSMVGISEIDLVDGMNISLSLESF
ncbi:MAG: DUF4430 domain-containing protein [Bacilli bacterium]